MIYYLIERHKVTPLVDTRIKKLKDQIVSGILSTSFDPQTEKKLFAYHNGELEKIDMCPKLLPHTPRFEGISHINMYSRSTRSLGKILSNFYEHTCLFELDGVRYYGRSIECVWQFLNKGDKEFLVMSSEFAKLRSSKVAHNHMCSPEQFKQIIQKLMLDKIQEVPGILKELKELQIPVLHYYSTPGRDFIYKDECPGLLMLNEIIENIKSGETSC